MIRSGLRVPESIRPCPKVSVSCTLQPSPSRAVRTKRRIWRSSSTRIATGSGSAMGGLRFFGGRGRVSQRQGGGESRAAALPGGGGDLALMRFDDGAANRQSKPYSRCRRFAFAPGEFLKYRLLPPGGQ